MSAQLRSEAAWRAFFNAATGVGIGAVAGLIAGFFVGSLADLAIVATTGDDQWRFGYVFAQIGIYIGLFLGIVAGIGTSASTGGRPRFDTDRR